MTETEPATPKPAKMTPVQRTMIAVVIAFSAAVVFAVATIALLGSRLPKDHEARAKKTVSATPAAIFAALEDVSGQAKWFPGVTGAEKISEAPERWRQHMERNSFVLETKEKLPPSPGTAGHVAILERTIVDDHGPFTGSWRFELRDDGAGTEVTLIERGHVESVPGRFFLHYATGPDVYAREYLESLAKHFPPK